MRSIFKNVYEILFGGYAPPTKCSHFGGGLCTEKICQAKFHKQTKNACIIKDVYEILFGGYAHRRNARILEVGTEQLIKM